MARIKNVIALTGSTRGLKTTSESMVNYVATLLDDTGLNLKKYRAFQIFQDEDKVQKLLNSLEESDLLLICTPVYVHSLPYPLLNLLEQLSEKTSVGFWRDKKMLAIIHSGYPKDIQRKASLAICKNFADQMSIEWLGGLGFGGSPIIDGRPLAEVGRFTKWMRRSLDEMSKSIITGNIISDEAKDYAKRHFPGIPLWILKIMLNQRAKSTAKKNGINLYGQPYLAR